MTCPSTEIQNEDGFTHMWIEVPEHLKRIKTPEMDEAIEFGDSTKVQVTKDVGEQLVKLDGITNTQSDNS